MIGVTGLSEFSLRDRRAVVGTWHGREWWGTGANRQSKTLVLALAFRGLGLERVTAWCGADNGRSQKALERLGFVHEGVLRRWHVHRGEPKDVISYSMLSDEWEAGELAREPVEIVGRGAGAVQAAVGRPSQSAVASRRRRRRGPRRRRSGRRRGPPRRAPRGRRVLELAGPPAAAGPAPSIVARRSESIVSCGKPASCSASSSARSTWRPGGTTSFASPIRSASSACTGRPVRVSSSARPIPDDRAAGAACRRRSAALPSAARTGRTSSPRSRSAGRTTARSRARRPGTSR